MSCDQRSVFPVARLLLRVRTDNPVRPRFLRAMSVSFILAVCPFSNGFGIDGELDPSFDPPAEAMHTGWESITVVNNQLYLARAHHPPIRLNDDGSIDPSFPGPLPGNNPSAPHRVSEVIGSPFGDLIVVDSRRVYGVDGSGDTFFVTTDGVSSLPGSAFAFDDGSFLFRSASTPPAEPIERYTHGHELVFSRQRRVFDWTFHRRMELLEFRGVYFDDGSGFRRSLGIRTMAKDNLGRVILIGNIQTTGSSSRIGLFRFHSDGRLDSEWNPSADLGIDIGQDERMTAFPWTLAVGPTGNVLVVLRRQSVAGSPKGTCAVIDERGTIVAEFPYEGKMLGEWTPPPIIVAQPDGKFLIGGPIESWQGNAVTGLIRIFPDGSFDPTFNVELNPVSDEQRGVWAMTLDERGRLSFLAYSDAVNGVPRPGLARVFAYDPPMEAVHVEVSSASAQVAPGEELFLTAKVSGNPPPSLQWYRNGQPLEGQIHRGLRIPIQNAVDVGTFQLVATDHNGASHALKFPPVELVARSRRPGTVDPDFDRTFSGLLPLAPRFFPAESGKVLATGGASPDGNRREMVVRLTRDLARDNGFGHDGAVVGDGVVESLKPTPDGGLLLAGHFTEVDGQFASGMAFLSLEGLFQNRDYPVLDQPHVRVALPLADGKVVIAGRFREVDGIPVMRGLARLNSDLTLDSTFVAPVEFEDEDLEIIDLATDGESRVLIAAGPRQRITPLREPPGIRTRLYRLRGNGSIDPSFDSNYITAGVMERIFVEPGGTIVVPAARMSSDGTVATRFERRTIQVLGPLVPLPSGQWVTWKFTEVRLRPYPTIEILRFTRDGDRDNRFHCVFDQLRFDQLNIRYDRLNSMVGLDDGSILLAISHMDFGEEDLSPAARQRLVRVLPDSDTRFERIESLGETFEATLATQTERTYRVFRRNDLRSDESSLVAEFEGNGYPRRIRVATEFRDQLFLELQTIQGNPDNQ